ncbi:sigma factor-like helix-turn-helix DNA-binding protein [Desulfallas thermosapovorans]|uniref:Sigma-70-like protein n=1 Tax=Desulfallas thermosapovorans DSM 6562 TaxID=1121431 RepID=A0A5S4ZMP4_9FIRM|nr:sigma factor-like helix-turn-helix DNA-binding protein [Desulfallas thermosapovorans]TYO92298.1 sigma-70-like protein [Desulfallas thermosapovorans DSM 6562]
MDTKRQLYGINRLLADVYGENIRISALLADYLDAAQLEFIKTEKLAEFLRMMVFGIRCCFVTIAGGMRLYSILSARYGLEGEAPRTLAQIGEIEGVTRERIRQLEQKALHRLKPTTKFNVLKQLACLAAREVLGIVELPAWPGKTHDTESDNPPPPSTLTAESLEKILITDDVVTLKTLHQNINSAVGAERGNPGHIRYSMLRHWLIENGYLKENNKRDQA